MVNKRKLLIPILVLAFIAPIITADVVYIYTGTINVTTTTSPISFNVGPNGAQPISPSAPQKGYYVYVTTSNTANSFTANINITNSGYDFFYEAVTMSVSQTVNLYIANVSAPGAAKTYINNMWIVISSSSTPTTYIAELKVISNGQPTTSTSAITLASGTYYISILVQPNTPLPNAGPTTIATVTVQFGDNAVASSAIPLPPTP